MGKQRKSFPELQSWDPPFQEELIAHLGGFVRAVVALRPGVSRPEPWGSAVPAAYAGQPLLLTAAHVLARRDDRQLLLEVPDRFEPIGIRDANVLQDPATDAAVIRLPDASFGWGLTFLDLEVQEIPEIQAGDVEVYIAMGFPVRETSHEVDAGRVLLKRVNYRAFECSEAYDVLGLSRVAFVITRFDRKFAYHRGFVRSMKLPHGMSGGGLWRFWGPKSEAPSPARGGFAGILTEYRETPVKCMISVGLSPLQDLASRLVRQTAKG